VTTTKHKDKLQNVVFYILVFNLGSTMSGRKGYYMKGLNFYSKCSENLNVTLCDKLKFCKKIPWDDPANVEKMVSSK